MLNRVLRYAAGVFVLIFIFLPLKSEAYAPGIVLPTHISIVSAGVSADVIDIGLTKKGNLDVPPNFVQTGWYKYGSIPGLPGNAVIDGHVDNGGSVRGPFKNLKSVKKGDKIAIAMSDGSVKNFIISDATAYPLAKFPGKSVFIGNGAPVLKLITCHGKFIKSLGTYDQRLIVTATLEV